MLFKQEFNQKALSYSTAINVEDKTEPTLTSADNEVMYAEIHLITNGLNSNNIENKQDYICDYEADFIYQEKQDKIILN